MSKFCGTLLPGSLFVLFALLFSIKGLGQSYGLEFASHEVVPEKRTALNLTPGEPFCFTRTTELEFELKFRPNLETYFGYIVRVIADGGKKNIDIVYNQILRNFNFVVGEESQVFELDSATLHGRWNIIKIRFDKIAGKASLFVNGKLQSEQHLRINRLCLRMLFGGNDSEGYQTVDMPPMQIRNIRITEGNELKHHFSLSESNGSLATDSITRQTAKVINPSWLKPKHQRWALASTFTTSGAASIAFDEKKEIVYIVSRDSLYQYSLKNGQMTGSQLSSHRGLLPAGNQSVYHPGLNKLVNFFTDEKKVSLYDTSAKLWNADFKLEELTEYWQANKFISPFDSSLYIVGGYGQLRYKNSIFRYHFPSQSWDTLQPSGDFFMPRYLSALGLNATKDTAFILGGYGSSTGDQKINPKHSYELLAYSIRTNTFTKWQQLAEPSKHFALANSLVIDSATRDYYTLVYARDRFNSSLQLLKGSLDSPAYTLVADSMPYPFHDIESFVDLFYSQSVQKLVAVVLFTGKDHQSSVKIYTLNFPPNNLVVNAPVIDSRPRVWLMILIAAIGLAAVAAYFMKRRRPKYGTAASDLTIPVNSGNKLPPLPGTAKTSEASGNHVISDSPELAGKTEASIESETVYKNSSSSNVDPSHRNGELYNSPPSSIDDVPNKPENSVMGDAEGTTEIAGRAGIREGSAFSAGAGFYRPADTRQGDGPSVFLFGQFHVTDLQGADITRQFTPLLKELFLLIVINTYQENQGISSESLTEILWQNKSEKDAKNNRSVNIAKLKAVVEKMGTAKITKESGLWQLQVNDHSVYIDFPVFKNLLHRPATVDRSYIMKLLQIVRRGTFLLQTDYSWLDDIKSSVSNGVIDRLVGYIEKANLQEEAEFIIEICNAVFHFDRLNEQALEYKSRCLIILKRHALANTEYLNFTREYREMYHEEFSRPFSDIIR